MLAILQFIFSSFWVWAGTVFLVAVVSSAAANWLALIIKAARGQQ